MADVAIRLLGSEDLELVLATPAGLFDSAPDPLQTRAFLASPDHLLVAAIVENQIVSFASGQRQRHPDKTPIFFIAEVGTRDEWQRRGLATQVLNALVAEARALGCTGIWLATEQSNDAARGLYRSIGARETQQIVVYDWGEVMGDAED